MAIAKNHPLAESIEALASMPAYVESALARVPASRLAERATPDAFSLTEQACHLRDVEREGYLVRVRRMLDEDMPRLAGFDGAAVARERDYNAQDARIAATEFAAARAEVVALLGATTPGDLERGALFMDERITLAELVTRMMDHDREHRDEIAALAVAMEAAGWR
ncbi:MAG TPA: DinB family protein [Usitatibacter sp.]|jgi:hypothetical protein|nr:DinB family protein [Usitatibacter sp.]